jgi:hypothetical protein
MQTTPQKPPPRAAAQAASLPTKGGDLKNDPPELFRPAPYDAALRLDAPGGDAAGDDNTDGDGASDSLDDAARGERDYLRQRLRDDLGREPTDAELNEWLRQHTEGY